MSTALKRISPAEYLARERKAEFKSEFFDGEIFAMAGGSPTHSLIAANFVGEARQSLNGTPCVVYNSDLRIKNQATGLYTYPDASIVCGDLEFDDEIKDTVTNPTVIVEVLSDSTEKYDRGRKSSHYRQIPSVREIILISQDEAHVERFVRRPEGGWLLLEEQDLAGLFELSSLNVTIKMSDLYRHVKFEPPPSDESGGSK
jgi:Uma2 family endonuclease